MTNNGPLTESSNFGSVRTAQSKGDLVLREFDPLSETDLVQSATLMRSCWGETDFCDLRYLRWQYQDNPFGKALGSVLETPDGAFAAQYIAIPTPLWTGESERLGLLSANTATHFDYRGQGLFLKTAERTYEIGKSRDFSGVYGAPNDSSVRGFLKLGFTTLSPLRLELSIPSPLRLIASIPNIFRERHFPHFVEAQVDASKFTCVSTDGISVTDRIQLDSIRAANSEKKTHGRAFENQRQRSDLDQGISTHQSFGFAKPSASDSLQILASDSWLRWRFEMHPTRIYYSLKSAQGSNAEVVFRSFALNQTRVAVIMGFLGSVTREARLEWAEFFKRERFSIVANLQSDESESTQTIPSAFRLPALKVPRLFSPKAFHVIWKDLDGVSSVQKHRLGLGAIDLY